MDGVCLIKAEYCLNDLKKLINSEEQQQKDNADNIKRKLDESNNDNVENTTNDDGPSEGKKTKLTKREKKGRGQNKHRRRGHQPVREVNLCKVYFNGQDTGGSKCPFEKCKFLHDITAYMEAKPKDIGETCYIYSTKGFCSRGLTCRFASSHLDEQFNNLKADFYDESRSAKDIINQISCDLQIILRKKEYNFDLSKEVIAAVDKAKEERKNAAKTNVTTKETESVEVAPSKDPADQLLGFSSDTDIIIERKSEKKKIDFANKLYLSPLTTVGNLPFRRICKEFGVDITCGEMACAVPICNGISQEWALVKRHVSEDLFGVQLCSNNPQLLTFAAQLLKENAEVDFIDLNLGCPIELIYSKGGGSALIHRQNVLEVMVRSCVNMLGPDMPFTVKTRTGIYANKSVAHELVPKFENWGASAVTIHGRSREQRYTKTADWEYIEKCAAAAKAIPVIGNGDILNFEDFNRAKATAPSISSIMIGRGALIKPWLFKEIKEQKHWDPSSSERFEIMRKYVNYGLEHWGSDSKGVENTRRFFLEWQSFMYRYVPYGLLERPPQKINERPDSYRGRDDLETLMASANCADWIKLSEMFLGPVPADFIFLPKHKANSF